MSISGVKDGSIYEPKKNIFDYSLYLDEDLTSKMSSYREELENMIIDCRKRVVEIKMQNLEKKNKNRISHNILKGDFVIIKTFDKGYEKKYRPIFGMILYKVIKSKKSVIFLENTITRQEIMRHATDVRKIDFYKLSKLEISKHLADTFELVTLKNLNEIFQIQPMSSRNIKNAPEIVDISSEESSSSSDEEYYDDSLNNKDTLPVITEEN